MTEPQSKKRKLAHRVHAGDLHALCALLEAQLAVMIPDHSADVRRGLAQLLVAKRQVRDVEGTILSPCASVDGAWHSLLLRPVSYLRINRALGFAEDEILDHRPEGALEAEEKQSERLNATRTLCKSIFGDEFNVALWSDDAPVEGPVNIVVVDLLGVRHKLRLSSADTGLELREAFKKKKKSPNWHGHFVFGGKKVKMLAPLSEQRIKDKSTVHSVTHHRGC